MKLYNKFKILQSDLFDILFFWPQQIIFGTYFGTYFIPYNYFAFLVLRW